MICLQFAWFEVRSCNIQDLDYLLHILLQLHGKVEIFIKYSIYSQRKPPDFMKKPGVHFFSLPSVCTSLSVLYSVMTSFAENFTSHAKLLSLLQPLYGMSQNPALSAERVVSLFSPSEFWHCSETHQAVLKLGSISRRCSGIWARAPPLEPTSWGGGKTEHERSAEIEPMHNSAIFGCLRDKKIWRKLLKKVWTRYQHMTTMENNCFWMSFT